MEAIPSALTEFGIPGIVIAGLGYAVAALFKRYSEVQDKRIEDARETIEAISENTRALETLAELIRAKGGA